MGIWNITLPTGNDHELMCEMERSGLEYCFIFIQNTGSATKLLNQEWSQSYSGVPTRNKPQVSMGILSSPRDRGVAAMRFFVSGKKTPTQIAAQSIQVLKM